MITIAVVLLLCFASLWVCVLYLVPQLVDSLFRYRLWKVRDDLQGYLFDEKLPESPAVNELLEMVEDTIRRSSSIAISKFIIFRSLWKSKESNAKSFDFSDLPEEQRDLINALMHELYLSITFKEMAGSPVGAFFLPFWLIYYKNRSSGLAPQPELRNLRQLKYTLRNDKSEPKDLVATVG